MMPKPRQPDAETNLDARIEQLVGEMTEATAQIQDQLDKNAMSEEAYAESIGLGGAESNETFAEEVTDDAAEESTSESEVVPEPEPELESESEHDVTVPETAIDSAASLEESEPLADTATETIDEPEAASDESDESSLDSQIEEMLGDVALSEEVSTNEQDALATEAPVSHAVEAVDAELAELADEMLDGDFDDVEDVLSAGEDDTPPPAAASPDELEDGEDLLEGDFDDGEDIIEQGEPEPAPEPVAAETPDVPVEPANSETETPAPASPRHLVAEERAPSPQAASAVAASTAESSIAASANGSENPAEVPETPGATASPDAFDVPDEQSQKSAKTSFASTLIVRTRGTGYALVERLNKPLEDKPAHLRDIAGWLAAVTLFNALCVWGFMLIVRAPDPGTSDEPQVELVGSETQPAGASDAQASVNPSTTD